MDDAPPVSLAAARAERSGNAADWTAVDVLRDCLRRIETKEIEVDAIVVVWREKHGPAKTNTHFAQCGPDVHTALGLLSAAAIEIYQK